MGDRSARLLLTGDLPFYGMPFLLLAPFLLVVDFFETLFLVSFVLHHLVALFSGLLSLLLLHLLSPPVDQASMVSLVHV